MKNSDERIIGKLMALELVVGFLLDENPKALHQLLQIDRDKLAGLLLAKDSSDGVSASFVSELKALQMRHQDRQ